MILIRNKQKKLIKNSTKKLKYYYIFNIIIRMGWFHDIGNKIKGEVHSLGNKINKAGSKAAKFIHKVAPVIKDVASTISKDAGIVGGVAEAALPFTAEIPLLGEVVGGLAAGAEAVSGAAGMVSRGAGKVDSLTSDIQSGKAIERAGKGVKSAAMGSLLNLSTQGARTGTSATRGDVKKEASKIGMGAFNRFVG